MRNLTTLPQSTTMRAVLPVGQCVVTHDSKGRELAYYPARWNAHIPNICHVRGDAYWIVRMADGSTYRTASQR